MGRLSIVAIFATISLVAICLASCSAGSFSEQPETGLDIPWPPAEGTIKFSSDDSIVLNGQDWTAIGGDSFNQPFPPNSLYLGDEDDYSWATYSLGGFNDTLEFSGLTFNCEYRPTGPDDGSELHLGFANYTIGTWEWFTPGDGEYVHDVPDDTDYVSSIGSVHFAVVFLSPEDNAYTNILSLDVEREGNTDIAPPSGLTADPARDEITLTWLDVPTADGYHIYRDVTKDFAAPEKLTDGDPVIGLTYLDDSVDRGVMYYYKASSILDIVESALSPYVDTFSPDNTKEMPVALGGYSMGPDDYNVQWSWGGSFPDYFRVYYSEEPDFNLELPTDYVQVSGIESEAKLNLSKFGSTIYWRVSSYHGSRHGLMTDDIIGQTVSIWEWGSTEELGNGTAPISLVKVGGDYSAAYINGNDVDFSRRNAGTWSTETAITGDTFGAYVAISHAGSEYVIATQDNIAHDLWIANGTPGSWSSSRVHGTNSEGMDHPISGNTIQAASSSTEHVVIHSGEGNVMIHAKPNGSGSWSSPSNLWTASSNKDHMSMVEMGGNFYLLWHDPFGDELMMADKNGGWAQTDVLGASTPGIGEYNCLTRFDDEWWTPVYDSTAFERQLRFLNGSTPPWDDTLHQDSGNVGEFASMAALDTKLFCVYFRRDADAWEFALYDGSSWETNWFVIPGVEFSRAVAGGIGDSPYVLYDDIDAGKVYAVTGTPPT